MPLVPPNASEVQTSEDYKLFQTTKTGVQFYVRALETSIADTIKVGSHDFKFLCGQSGDQCLLVLIRNGQILRGEPKPYGDLENSEVTDVMKFLLEWESRAS